MSNHESIGDVVAIIPAAGHASRISPLPCSKELYPIGLHADADQLRHPKVVSQYLLEKFKRAAIGKVFICLRKGKWDILDYYGDGSAMGLDIAYLITHLPWGAPFTIDRAFGYLQNSVVALGFPDILFEPEDAFATLLSRLENSRADMLLGLFPTKRAVKVDMIEIDPQGRVSRIEIKPANTSLRYAWAIAVWRPRFSKFMHEFLKSTEDPGSLRKEWYVGHVIEAAIEAELQIEGVPISEQSFLDIGTPDDLLQAIHRCVPDR